MRGKPPLDPETRFTRRALLLGGLQAGLFCLLAGRLYQLQVKDAAHFRMLADENRIALRLVPPPRGRILDRLGLPLAENRHLHQAVIEAGIMPPAEARAFLDKFATLLSLTDEERERAAEEITQSRPGTQILLKDNLTWDELAALELARPDLPQISVETGETRSYPLAEATAHVLGHVGLANDADLKAEPEAVPLLRVPGFRIGKDGAEKQFESTLRGAPGNLRLEVNAHGQVVRELQRTPPNPGNDARLTIDAGLQAATHARLAKETSAAAVIMDALRGDVYAMASSPAFDPNQFALGIPGPLWKNLLADERVPLLNKPIAGLYAPGSTFKMAVALAALEAGMLDVNARVFCSGHIDLGSHRFHCWKRGGHGSMNAHSAIAESCDVFFYDVARRIGIDRIAGMAGKLGLGKRTGLDLAGEKAGLVPTPLWKRQQRRGPWQSGETLIVSIGQGAMLSTPLQLAVMAARLVNGGRAVTPHLLKKREGESEPAFASLGLKSQNLAFIKEAMDAVVNTPQGTAQASRLLGAGQSMGGKTGTSQVRRISMAERARGIIPNEERPWRDRDHALFVGYAPVKLPRYTCAVIVEHGGGGSKTAAPLARDILKECLERNPAGG